MDFSPQPALQVQGSEQLLALAGALNVLLGALSLLGPCGQGHAALAGRRDADGVFFSPGFYAIMSVYTCDEKAKRNSGACGASAKA